MRTLLTALARLLGFVPEQEVYDWVSAELLANHKERARRNALETGFQSTNARVRMEIRLHREANN
jgi:hypothetical protein